MLLVQGTTRAQVIRRGAALAALLGLAAGVVGCGGESDGGDRPPPHANARIGQPVRLVNCTDWRRASIRERQGTIEELERFAGGPTGSPAGRGSTLPEDKAYDVLENWCRNDFARGFRLYKLYTRAAAFQNQR